MKKYILFISSLFLLCNVLQAQIYYNHKIDSVINLISVQSLSKMNRELSGDTIAVVGGIPQIIYSRYYLSPGKRKATQYIYEKFQSYGYTPFYQGPDSTCINVVAEKIGTKYPNRKYVICAHYDDIIWPVNPGIYDTIHGADDNASGVCTVLEIARLLKNFNTDYTLVFIAFDKEETGTYGSKYYTDSVYMKGDTILGALNIDMIAFNAANNKLVSVATDTNSMTLANNIIECASKYQIDLIISKNIDGYGSDHIRFWARKYRALNWEEKILNPFYHTINDVFSKFNITFFSNCAKVSAAVLLSWALDYNVRIEHEPIQSSPDTSARTAKVIIHFPVPIATGINSPRLYYKVNNESYNFVNSFYHNLDTFKFRIPGRTAGNLISYYLAVQDSTGNNCGTLPDGGSGINPPGTTPPPIVYSYQVCSIYNQCSNTLPKPINDFQSTFDTIQISQDNKLVDFLKINLTIYHPNDGDLYIQLTGPGGMINLSQGNGSGGANYINTTFDDSATTSITQATPPFTGSFKPQSVLSFFSNKPASAKWILRVFDSRAGNTGTLVNWCILMQLKNSVGIKEENIPVNFELFQNYPNPFNPVTNIKYQIARHGGSSTNVKLIVFDILGKEVTTLVNENQKAGEYLAVFDGSGLASGIYFYKLTAGDFSDMKKMLLIK